MKKTPTTDRSSGPRHEWVRAARRVRMRAAAGRALLPAAAALLLAACEAIVPYHARSAESDEESTAVVLEYAPDETALPATVIIPSNGVQPGLHPSAAFIEGRIFKEVMWASSASARGPALWIARAAGPFYAAPPAPETQGFSSEGGLVLDGRVALRGFKVERCLKGKPATSIELSIEPRDGSFRVVLDRVRVEYSRCKVGDSSWRNWWSRIPLIYGFGFDIAEIFSSVYGDRAIDMQVDVIVSATWTDRSGASCTVPLALLGWTLLDVPLGEITVPVGTSSGWIPAVPPSFVDPSASPPVFGQGLVTISVVVTEQDEFTTAMIAGRQATGEYVADVLSAIGTLLPVP